ncbi:MAG: urease accessory protein UreF [Nitratireductor sp.]|nr:urease accessory protein UreF [Nitratireductor sp.]
MSSSSQLLRLMAWLSPVFPTGGFAYSAGLEQAVTSALVRDEDSLSNWLEILVRHGSAWNDAVLLVATLRQTSSPAAIAEIAGLALALSGSAERHHEAVAQGKSFREAVGFWFDDALPADLPLPVAVGLACGKSAIDPETALVAWLNTFVSNQLQCAIRLSVVGQQGAARILARLEPVLADIAQKAANSSLDDLGSAAIMAEIACMKHEILQPRLFLS